MDEKPFLLTFVPKKNTQFITIQDGSNSNPPKKKPNHRCRRKAGTTGGLHRGWRSDHQTTPFGQRFWPRGALEARKAWWKKRSSLIPKHIPELYIEKKIYTYIYVCVYIYIYIYPGEDISWVDFHGFPDFERKQAFRWRVTFVFQALEHTKNQRTNRPTFNYHLKRWLYEIINNYILYTSTVYIYIHTYMNIIKYPIISYIISPLIEDFPHTVCWWTHHSAR